jgi:hypothetical protein
MIVTATPYGSLWDSIIQRAGDERARIASGRSVVNRGTLESEVTPFGLLRWYLHNDLEEPVTRALYFFELEIPPGSRSGRLRHQGGIIHLVVEGHGHTMYGGERNEWEKGDVIAIPVRPEGMELQHFNDGGGPVRMVVSWVNFDSALGPAGGVALEVTEAAPEYESRS